jgi:hypothetical protein
MSDAPSQRMEWNAIGVVPGPNKRKKREREGEREERETKRKREMATEQRNTLKGNNKIIRRNTTKETAAL